MTHDDCALEISDWLVIGKSTINGFGLFSRRTISRGEIVGGLCGVVLPAATKRTIQIGRHRHLCSDQIDFVNHHCRPNTYVQVEGDSIVLKAIDHVASEIDEITIDYNCSEYSLDESFMCRCCEIPSGIFGYKNLVETGQVDYLRRIDRFVLPHLVNMSFEGRRL